MEIKLAEHSRFPVLAPWMTSFILILPVQAVFA